MFPYWRCIFFEELSRQNVPCITPNEVCTATGISPPTFKF
jgi:hypothetical protein